MAHISGISGRNSFGRVAPRTVLAAAVALLAGAIVRADSSRDFPGDVPDTFRLNLGGMYAWFNTDVAFQENLTPGGPIEGGIDFQDTLGIPSSRAGFSARGSWNFAGRSFVDFGYTGFSRTASNVLTQDIDFGGETFTANVGVGVKTHLPYIDYRYGFIKNESTQLGLTIGVAYPVLQAKISTTAGIPIPGGPVIGVEVARTAEVSTAVPLLGVQFDGKLGDRLSGGVIFHGIFAPVHPYVGSIFDAEAHLEWFLTRNFGIGGGFEYTKFNIKRENENSLVDFSYDYYGPRLAVIVTF